MADTPGATAAAIGEAIGTPAADKWSATRPGSVVVAYALFAMFGAFSGVSGVLLPAQIADYGVDKATIGITFFASAGGYVVASALTGPLVGRLGTRSALLGAGVLLVGMWLATAGRPPFALLVLLYLLVGLAMGLQEALLNVYLADRPGATAMLNRLHAFFGVGALLGPLLAAWLLTFTAWTTAMLVLAGALAPLVAAAAVTYPARADDPLWTAGAPAPGGPVAGGPVAEAPAGPDGRVPRNAPGGPDHPDQPAGGVGRPPSAPSSVPSSVPPSALPAVLRRRAVLLGAGLLAVYVGLEITVGNWGYTYLVEQRSVSGLLAGYTASGYWLGLTAGRFLMSSVSARLRLTQSGLMYACMAGTTVAGALAWAAPGSAGLVNGAFVLIGFFLGPIFPTMMAVTPRLAPERLVPTAIGVLSAGGLIGGSLFPWLAGTLLQVSGAWTLLPFAIALALVQLALWWRVARRLAPAGVSPAI